MIAHPAASPLTENIGARTERSVGGRSGVRAQERSVATGRRY